jgi:hypothetical protein
MFCSRSRPRRANSCLIALKCMVITRRLVDFLDQDKALPIANPSDREDDFAWAQWLLGGNLWDLRKGGISYENRKFLRAALADIKEKPHKTDGTLFSRVALRESLVWRRATAQRLLNFFSSLHDIANGADLVA